MAIAWLSPPRLFFYSARVVVEAIIEFTKLIHENANALSDKAKIIIQSFIQFCIAAVLGSILFGAIYRFYFRPRTKELQDKIARIEREMARLDPEAISAMCKKAVAQSKVNMDRAKASMDPAENILAEIRREKDSAQ